MGYTVTCCYRYYTVLQQTEAVFEAILTSIGDVLANAPTG